MMKLASMAADAIRKGNFQALPPNIRVFQKSVFHQGGSTLAMVRIDGTDCLLIFGRGPARDMLPGSRGKDCTLSPLTVRTREALGALAPFTVPVSCGPGRTSMGLGDRLGIATPGHIRAVTGRDVFPVFAQQSTRELALTGRDYGDVLNAAAFAVFREGYRSGYGADADHLKSVKDIKDALAMGFSMITLDCSDELDARAGAMDDATALERYARLETAVRSRYESRYLEKSFTMGGMPFTFGRAELARLALVYHRAVDYMCRVHDECIAPLARSVDFEISIDETSFPTSPAAHYLVASELAAWGVKPASIAPRFCGEFQKGIDYRGDIERFRKELGAHAEIARIHGHRLSIHSGSDKFLVFPNIAKATVGRVHVKTSGTSWLEALKVAAGEEPALYREMRRYAIENFAEARKLYHIDACLLYTSDAADE